MNSHINEKIRRINQSSQSHEWNVSHNLQMCTWRPLVPTTTRLPHVSIANAFPGNVTVATSGAVALNCDANNIK
jgi:hypothetical protein